MTFTASERLHRPQPNKKICDHMQAPPWSFPNQRNSKFCHFVRCWSSNASRPPSLVTANRPFVRRLASTISQLAKSYHTPSFSRGYSTHQSFDQQDRFPLSKNHTADDVELGESQLSNPEKWESQHASEHEQPSDGDLL